MITYIKVLPKDYTPSEALPLVAFFPGHKGTALKFKKLFAGQHLKRRFVGIYFNTPEGGWNMAEHETKVCEIMADATETPSPFWCAVGISNGACFALQMQCEYYFLGVASFAGSLFNEDNTGASELRKTMMFNGKKDNSVPYNGGKAHGVDMMGAVATFKEMSELKEWFVEARLYGQQYYTRDHNILLYAFDNYGHDVYPKVSNELKWNLPEMVLNFFGIPKI